MWLALVPGFKSYGMFYCVGKSNTEVLISGNPEPRYNSCVSMKFFIVNGWCVWYIPVFTLAVKEINLSGSTKSYVPLGCFREVTLPTDCDTKCCNC